MISAIRTNLPVFVVIIPLFLAFILPTFARRIKLVEGLVISVEILWLIAAGCLAYMVLLQKATPIIYSLGDWAAPWGIELKIDSLAAFFLLVVTAISLPVALFANADELGVAAMLLGAGRETMESELDLAAGLILHKKIGDPVKKDEIILTIHSNMEDVDASIKKIKENIEISDHAEPLTLIHEIIH